MGCTQSKIENEEAVTRCKDRKQFMKQAVSSRNAFAAAHSAYAMSLKNTGAALSDYAHGEVQHPHIIASPTHTGGPPILPPSITQSHYENLPPPPPPLPNFAASPLQRAASMPEISVHKPELKHADTIDEENEEDELENEPHGLKHRSSRSIGGGSGNKSGVSARDAENEGFVGPPSPPRTPPETARAPPPPPSHDPRGMQWDYFFPSMENVPASSLAEVDEGRDELEEIQRKMNGERARRSDGDDEGRRRRSGKEEAIEEEELEEEVEENVAELPTQPPPPPAAKPVKKVKQVVAPDGRRGGKVGPTVSLVQIFGDLDDCFLKASESAYEVLKMLEANRLHYHSNFADNRGHIDHSARVMRVITWNRSFRNLPNNDDGQDDFDSEEHETHATVLDKMLAWEKKLYDEVKAGEQMKIEYQRKVASLNKLKKRNASTETIEKTKAAVSHLHTRYIVDMQSMDSTVSEINRLRDHQLYPKLVDLVQGMGSMWEAMQVHHENQSKIVTALRYLDISQSPKETTDHHHDRTVQLWAIVKEWHSQLEKLMTNQKEYTRALNSWLKLNLIPIDNNLKEKVSSPQRPQTPPIQALLHAWHDFLEKLPDEHARTAINNFAAVVQTIVQYQIEEMKLRDRCEETRKELSRKTRQFEDWFHKYMQKRTPPDDMDPERAQDDELVAERQIAVEALKKRLEEEEAAYQRQCIQVREKSLTSLKTRLPELFRALLDFSGACSDMYRSVQAISQHRKPKQST